MVEKPDLGLNFLVLSHGCTSEIRHQNPPPGDVYTVELLARNDDILSRMFCIGLFPAAWDQRVPARPLLPCSISPFNPPTTARDESVSSSLTFYSGEGGRRRGGRAFWTPAEPTEPT